MSNIKSIIEAALFVSDTPQEPQKLAKLFDKEERPALGEIRAVLNELQEDYKDRSINLVEVASGFRFQICQEVAPAVAQTFEEKPAKLSRALLETLALIAYRQPITRGEIEDIRGVVVSTNIIRTLQEQHWVRVVGHKEVPGKPALYATTKNFLDHFNLQSLDQLPPLSELKANLIDIRDEVIEKETKEHEAEKLAAEQAELEAEQNAEQESCEQEELVAEQDAEEIAEQADDQLAEQFVEATAEQETEQLGEQEQEQAYLETELDLMGPQLPKEELAEEVAIDSYPEQQPESDVDESEQENLESLC